jgi:hypothetical protein
MSDIKKIKPITPDEIMGELENIIPQSIILAVNELLTEKYRGTGDVSIKQKDIIERAILIDETLTSNIIFEKKYMDFEELYKKSGWSVSYDKPAYNENYDAYFIFNKKKK